MKTPPIASFRCFLITCALLFAGPRLVAAEATTPTQPIVLFDGRSLEGWAPYARDAEPPASATWQVADGVIRCLGKPNGYLTTAGRYRDYKLTLEWRWSGPAPVDAQGRTRGRNSGVLLHMQGENAIWPKSLEAQLGAGNAGDFWVIGGVESAELLALREKSLATTADEKEKTRARNNRRVQKQKESSEKPIGEWNTYEIVCRGDTVVVSVNGVEQNRATQLSVKEGHICLQSEGAPIEFRNLKLEPLK